MSKPALSICVFAYKQQDQIRKYLDIAKTISFDNIEVLISDDTEDDSIKRIVESYNDSRFRHVFNKKGHGADSNYLNAMEEALAEYVWIFRSTDYLIADSVDEVIELIQTNSNCALYHFSSCSGSDCIERTYKDEKIKYKLKKYNSKHSALWRSGTLHPSGYIINKKYCDFELYRKLICDTFDDYLSSNVAFILQLADLCLKGETCFSSIVAWKYTDTIKRSDVATNAPWGKNPFALEFEYKRYKVLFDYSATIEDVVVRNSVNKVIIHTFAKQILHVFGKRNSNLLFLEHYGCDAVEFDSRKETTNFIRISKMLIENSKPIDSGVIMIMYREAILYGIIKPMVYKVRNK